jgi:hypothetical protein
LSDLPDQTLVLPAAQNERPVHCRQSLASRYGLRSDADIALLEHLMMCAATIGLSDDEVDALARFYRGELAGPLAAGEIGWFDAFKRIGGYAANQSPDAEKREAFLYWFREIHIIDKIMEQLASVFPTLPRNALTFIAIRIPALQGRPFSLKHALSSPTKAQLTRIAKLADDLSEALLRPFGTRKLEAELKELSQKARKRIEMIDSLSRRRRKFSHRPRGSVQYPALYSLTYDLYKEIEVDGGCKLTLGRSFGGDLGGTFPSLLRILRPYLGHRMPPKLSYSTLHQALRAAKTRYARYVQRMEGADVLPSVSKST